MPLIARSTGIDHSGLPPVDNKPLKIPPGVTFDLRKLDNTLVFSDTLKLKPSFVYNNHDRLNGQLKKRSQAFAMEKATQKREFSLAALGQYGAYVPYIGLSAFKGLTSYFLENIFMFEDFGTDRLIAEAIEYWRKKAGPDLKIPDFGFVFEDGKLELRRTESSVKDIIGATAETSGAVIGPIGAAVKASGLVASRFVSQARSLYQKIARGMITGLLTGEGEKDQTLENMALFGVFESLAYFLGRAPELPGKIRESSAWREMTIKERGLMIQELDQAADNAAKYLQLMKERGLSSEGLEFLAEAQEKVLQKKWDNLTRRQQAIEKRGQPESQRVGEEKVKTKAEKSSLLGRESSPPSLLESSKMGDDIKALHSLNDKYNKNSDYSRLSTPADSKAALKDSDKATDIVNAGGSADGISDVTESTGRLWKPSKFEERTVYQRGDLIDLKRVDPKDRTSLERIEKGLAPYGPDDEPMNLHHSLQSNESALVEVTRTLHQQKTKTIHINKNTTPSVIDRRAFRAFRRKYCRRRAKDFK